MSDGKPASALIWSIFRPEINYFSKQSPLFPKETGEVSDATYAQPLDAPDRLRIHRRPGGSQKIRRISENVADDPLVTQTRPKSRLDFGARYYPGNRSRTIIHNTINYPKRVGHRKTSVGSVSQNPENQPPEKSNALTVLSWGQRPIRHPTGGGREHIRGRGLLGKHIRVANEGFRPGIFLFISL